MEAKESNQDRNVMSLMMTVIINCLSSKRKAAGWLISLHAST